MNRKLILLILLVTLMSVFFSLAGKNKNTAAESIQKCELSPLPAQCFDKLLRETVKTQGLNAGFDLFAKLYEREPLTADSCHSIAHTLGQAAYDDFNLNKTFKRVKEASFCRYGFYHGLLEVAFAKGKGSEIAKNFCWGLEKSSKIKNSFEVYQCFHGVGHGITDYYTYLGDGIQRSIDRGLLVCADVSQGNDYFQNTCTGGVFASTASSYIKGIYGFDMQDPYAVCKAQGKFYEFCYIDIPAAVMARNNFDFYKSKQIALDNLSPNLQPVVVETLSYVWAEVNVAKEDFSENIKACQNLPGGLNHSCIRGFIYGLLTSGKPNEEYKKARDFCSSSLLSSEEAKVCLDEFTKRAKTMYESSIWQIK